MYLGHVLLSCEFSGLQLVAVDWSEQLEDPAICFFIAGKGIVINSDLVADDSCV